ncbi:MAG: ABC transporter ATP-binding protein [Firmicutes bacterium]|nr:ABC transporter ATP-binding protein [Bacillota bacterium]
MQNYHEEEVIGKAYDSRLMKRLLAYAKPYRWAMFLAVVLLVIITLVDLAKPWLVRVAIDEHINAGAYVGWQPGREPAPGIRVKGKILIPENKVKDASGGTVYQVIPYEGNNYLVAAVLSGKEYSVDTHGGTVYFHSEGQRYPGELISAEENAALRKADVTALVRLAVIYLFFLFFGFVVNYAQVYLLHRTGQKIIFDMRHKIFSHIQNLSMRFFDTNPVGRLITRVTNDTETLNDLFTDVLVNLFKDFFTLIGIILVMLRLNVRMALICFALLPIITVATVYYRTKARAAYRLVRVRLARINATLQESISGMRIIQIFRREKKKYEEFDRINSEHFEASFGELKVFAVFRPFINSMYTFGLALLIWFGGGQVLRGVIEFGVLYAFVEYSKMFFEPINNLAERYNIMQAAMASSERIFQLMDAKPEIENAPQPVKPDIRGNIEFRNVWFAYNPGEWVLRDVSFTVREGETVAFVGATGAGKTTIISLISRLYDIQQGQILIDGVDIRDIDISYLRSSIAVVLQDVFMFSGTIADNIRLSNVEIDDQKIHQIAEAVDADKFISALPRKYESEVVERGATLSAGQRQLLAFARALAFDPRILVLDEATANIDTETELIIQKAMRTISKDRTTLVVAHRLSTIQSADKIIVMHKGKIREMGNHQDLLAQEGLYYQLYQLQYKDQELVATS